MKLLFFFFFFKDIIWAVPGLIKKRDFLFIFPSCDKLATSQGCDLSVETYVKVFKKKKKRGAQ